MDNYHHRKLPGFSTLLCGRIPQNEFGFKSDRLQIWYNNTNESWVCDGESPHKHLNSDECFIVLKGSMVVDVDGDQFTLNAGEFCCFPAGIYHKIHEVHPPIETLIIRSPSIDDKEYLVSADD
jgi:mannose-6-phosphate isomerase-like protein (cupin superfamily)